MTHIRHFYDDDEDIDTLESDVEEDKIDLSATASVDEDRDGEGSHSSYFRYVTQLEGEGEGAPSPSAEPHEPLAIDSGPLRVLGFNRPLKRTRERLRPTSCGSAEVYKYDEGPEYEARLAREAEVLAEWKKHESAGHDQRTRTRGSLRDRRKGRG